MTPEPVPSSSWTAAAGLFSATLLIGVTGAIVAHGHDGLVYTLGIAGAAFLCSALFAPLLAGNPAQRTLPALLAHRYASPTVGFIASAVIVIALLGLLAAEMLVVGRTVSLAGIATAPSPLMIAIALVAATMAAQALCATPRLAAVAAATVAAVAVAALPSAIFALSGSDGLGALISVPALPDIAALEQGLIEKKLADPATFKPYASPFLRTDLLNTLALTVCLSFGLACLAAARSYSSLAESRSTRSTARAIALAGCALVLVPALAAVGRRSLLGVFAGGLKASALPGWLSDLRALEGVQLCGTVGGDAAALVKACGKGQLGLMRWQDAVFAQDGLIVSALAPASWGGAATMLLAAAATLCAIWTAREITRTIADCALPAPSAGGSHPIRSYGAIAAVFALAFVILAANPGPSVTLLAWSASLAAAGLAPALLAAFAPRPSAVAALIAIPLGAAVAATLILTARYDPLDAFAMSSAVSGAPPAVIRKMATLLQSLDAVSGEPARQAVLSQIEVLARDAVVWLGLKPLSCGAIGLVLSSFVMLAGTAISALRNRPS